MAAPVKPEIHQKHRMHFNTDHTPKVAYESKRAARAVIRNNGWDPAPNVYRCEWGDCRAWHIGGTS